MRQAHEGLEPKTFAEERPENVVEAVICEKSGFLATQTCKNYRTTRTEYFVSGTEPIQTCPYHSSAKVCTESGLLATEKCPRIILWFAKKCATTKMQDTSIINIGEYINEYD